MDRTSQRRKDNRGSNRYWSLMIVGEHGQVISMQRVKPLIWIVAACLVASIVIAAVAVFFCLDQRQKVAGLTRQLRDMEYKLDALRQEKDILMAKLVIAQQQNRRLLEQDEAAPARVDGSSRADKGGHGPAKAVAGGNEKTAASHGAADRKDPVAEVKLAVDIQRFQVSYDPVDQVLRAAFRIINVSRPKVSVSGRAVVVFKTTGSPPIKWLATPRVKLVDGEPDGKRGKLFRINNFKKMTFRASPVALPVVYDTASVYVFDRQGKLLLQREFEFSLPREPAPPETPGPDRTKTEIKPEPPAAKPAAKKADTQSSGDKGTGTGSVTGRVEKEPEPPATAGEIDNTPNADSGAGTGSASETQATDKTQVPAETEAPGSGEDASRDTSADSDAAAKSPDPGFAAGHKPESDK